MQKPPDDEQVAKLQVAILQYLADRPRASDTVRGIARYWTGTAGTSTAKPPSLEIVQRALDLLLAQGQIAFTTLADGTRVYESIRPNQPGDAVRRERPSLER